MEFEEKQRYPQILLSSFFALGAQITRPPGILLFFAYGIYILWKLINQEKLSIQNVLRYVKNYFPLLLVPIGLLGVFYWYSIAYQDFWAYFHSGDNIHLSFPPFQVFNKSQFWVGDIWLEDIIYIFILTFLSAVLLLKRKLFPAAFFVLTYLTASTFIAHRDISRYVMPVYPFALIAFEKLLISKEFKIVLIIVALGIYLYAQNFLLLNTAPYPNIELFN